ncbi:MAG: Eco57I restriction-modification methylase domain-containing protein, partial [Candidatus Hodarchaeota archaeon]
KRWNYSAAAKASFEVNYGILHQAANADIFAYFLEIAIRLLKSDGFFGFIVSDKWLDVSFGVNLKRFLLDETYLRRIVMIDQGVFSKAAVDCVVILGKRKAYRQCEKEFVTRFVRVSKVTNLQLTRNEKADSEIIQHIIPSSRLSAEERWSIYLKAPKIYNEIISSPKLEPLDQIATIKRGVTTGANQFFLLTKETIGSYSIPMNFVRPIVDSPRSLKTLIIDDAPLFVLAIPKNCSLEALPEGVRNYIREGEKRKYHQRKMVQARKPWYSLPLNEPAPLLAAKMMDKTPMFYLNPKGFLANNVFYEITPKMEQVQLIWLYLNSTVAHLLAELRGRSYHGGVLEIAAFELKRFPCLLPSELMPFSNEFRKLDVSSGHITQENRRIIDKTILHILGLKDQYKELQNAFSALQRYRLTKKERS